MKVLERTEVSSGLGVPSLKNRVSPEEWQTRVDLAACYRLVALHGLSDLIFSHHSARMPGTKDEFFLNPYEVAFEEVTASSLIKIDLDGNKLSDSPYSVNPSAYTVHSAIYAARPDVNCVVHTHSLNGAAVAAQKDGLLPLSQQSIFVLASLAYHDYDGISLEDEQKRPLAEDVGDKNYALLRNHGLLTLGPTIAQAFFRMYLFEASCIIQLRAQAGGELLHIPRKYIDAAPDLAEAQTLSRGAGAMVWPGLIRRLERTDPSYRT